MVLASKAFGGLAVWNSIQRMYPVLLTRYHHCTIEPDSGATHILVCTAYFLAVNVITLILRLLTVTVTIVFLCQYSSVWQTSTFFTLQVKFCEINLNHAVSLLVSAIHTSVFLFPEK